MRTWFEPHEAEEFEAAKDLLVRRCLVWAAERGMAAEPPVLGAALDFRHHSVDGRLAYWDEAQVRRFLLEWIPRHATARRKPPGTAPNMAAGTASNAVPNTAPDSLLTLLRYIAAKGLRDPRGATLAELEQAVKDVAASAPAALDRAALDRAELDRVAEAQFARPHLDGQRAFPQPPLTLPPAGELAEAAARSDVVRRLATLADWVGTEGKPLTEAGHLRLADARQLAELLGTGERDPEARGAEDLPDVGLLLAWAKHARIVRASKGRLLRVAKAAPLLHDPEKLWSRAFEAYFELGRDIPSSSSLLWSVFDELMPDVLYSMYGMASPMPTARLEETVWLVYQDHVPSGRVPEETWRDRLARELTRAFEVLAELGAVELSHGVADALYSSDLVGDLAGELPDDDPTAGAAPTLPAEARARLLRRLAEPGLLVRLTPLGARAARERMLAEGRDAPLIGELADASAAELLGVLVEHYPTDAAARELDGWLAAHGGDPGPLLDAVRACSFRTRAAAMLSLLTRIHPGLRLMLPGLRTDPVLGPIVLMELADGGDPGHGHLGADENLLVTTEGVLGLLELAGPEKVLEQLRAMAGPSALALVEAMAASGHPAQESMEELRRLVLDTMRARSHPLRFVPGPRPGARGRTGGRRRRR
ncbi:hypothetical protein [Microbispora bryophytorum]|uniref:Uncharacterized protein n=1 Tax=Microbispora bryophytorum TaxID=1460882 RepID=A0A8H9LGW0_9ACTN|nr:hypothetical protein [Microbispora bryophytorum]MBD3140876.1 hypothetical protein [Microbispora bryophytorum]TQS02114.1 hypothetical protein FLX07_29305 [Microbispora bryophytorum]GGO29325.1 hypothetical protein GCM10011574_64480 [Microbispora bryophytorum]